MAGDVRNPREVNDDSVDTASFGGQHQGNRYPPSQDATDNLTAAIDDEIAGHEAAIDLLDRQKESLQDEHDAAREAGDEDEQARIDAGYVDDDGNATDASDPGTPEGVDPKGKPEDKSDQQGNVDAKGGNAQPNADKSPTSNPGDKAEPKNIPAKSEAKK